MLLIISFVYVPFVLLTYALVAALTSLGIALGAGDIEEKFRSVSRTMNRHVIPPLGLGTGLLACAVLLSDETGGWKVLAILGLAVAVTVVGSMAYWLRRRVSSL